MCRQDGGVYFDIRPEDVALTEAQAKTLDDEFFLSGPMSHFSSRIAMLLAAHRDSVIPTPEVEPEFFAALGLEDAATALAFTEPDRNLQVAVDALALRHHVAEALTRFLHAVLVATPRPGDAPCVWLSVADGPKNMIDVITANRDAINADRGRLASALFPTATVIEGPTHVAFSTAIAWLNHAVKLLTDDELSINAANNKVKHGLAVSARGDVRIDLLVDAPVHDGKLPLSAFGEGRSVPIFDRPMLTYLNRLPARLGQGIEAVSLRVEVPVVLAEAWMLANVYGALFHIAAKKHFGGTLPESAAPYPRMVAGRLPADVLANRPMGYRLAVTLPPDPARAPRPSGLFLSDGFIPITIDHASKTGAVIVDD